MRYLSANDLTYLIKVKSDYDFYKKHTPKFDPAEFVEFDRIFSKLESAITTTNEENIIFDDAKVKLSKFRVDIETNYYFPEKFGTMLPKQYTNIGAGILAIGSLVYFNQKTSKKGKKK